jgi:uncharacterized protein (TIGR03067 family)
MKYALTAVAVGLLLAAAPDKDKDKDDAKKDREALQGTWKVVSAEQGGKAQDDATEYTMTFEKDTFTVKKGDELIVKGTFKIDPGKSPKTIDMTITEAKKEQDKDKELHGIYEVGKDELKWCSGEPGTKERPKEFATKEGAKTLLVTFKKDKS